jgi:hypothetical protein
LSKKNHEFAQGITDVRTITHPNAAFEEVKHMASRRGHRPIVPGAENGLEAFKAQVMKNEGFAVDTGQPQNVKYAVANKLGIPLQPGYNGHLTTESAGKVGGKIGGAMVREMVRMAQQNLAKR